jgi:hypothetical protein
MRKPALALALIVTASVAVGAEPASDDADSVVAVVLGRVIRESERDRATGIVVGTLFEQYGRKHGVAGTDAELEAFVARSRELQDQHRRERRAEVEVLRGKLAAPDLPGNEREKLGSRLELLERLLKSVAEMEAYREEHGEEMAAAEREVAEHFVQGWKLNRSLYERYGGRVIFQQAGPEPVDAYRAFLEEQRDEGAFQILAPDLEKEFWRYFVDDEMHTFLPDAAGKKAMATPWWLMDEPLEE